MQTITIYGNQSETDVTGAPYSAVERSIYSKKQPDGTYKDMTLTVTRIFRDWRGRMRSERYVTSYSSGDSPARLHSVYITDPVAGVFYRLDPDNRLATRNSWKTDEQAYADRKANGVVSRTGEPQFPLMTESLGTSTLEGLGVEGTRQTVSVPPGSLGNEREYYVIVETWSSPELKVAVLIKRDNSGLAMRTTTLTEIDRTEPDPTLFQVPADYAIVDAVGLIGYTSGAVP